MKAVWLTIYLLTQCVMFGYGMSPYGLACDPRDVRKSCLMGCLGCFEAFGGHAYNLAACCYDCKITDAILIDNGPAECSSKYIKQTWMSRYGK